MNANNLTIEKRNELIKYILTGNKQCPKGEKDGIVLHAFPLFALQLWVDWFEGILNRVNQVGQLSEIDAHRLESLRKIVRNLSGGIAAGSSVREWQRHQLAFIKSPLPKEVSVSIDRSAYELAEGVFQSLRTGSNK